MLLKIFKNRTVSSSGTWGTKNENNYEILNFEFPEELEEYNKRIVYYLGNQKVWDAIIDNKAILTNAITTKGSVKAYIWCTKSDDAFETDVDFRTQIFVMNFFENDNADGIVPTEQQVDGFNTMLTAMNEKIEEIDELETTIKNAETQRQENEQTRQNNESTRQENEQTRQSQEADRERRTNEAIGNIEDKTAEYNANAEEKTNEFNQNATQKTNDFNSNYTQKVNDFNTNASLKTSDFNSNAETKTNAFNSNATEKTTSFNDNASTKTSEFNTNAESKTSAFNDNAASKTNDFNDNASEKTDEFNTNAQEKIDEYDEHIVEYQAQIDELQEEVEELSENMPWATTEQATEIDITDAAKYSKNKLELFGNTEQTIINLPSGYTQLDYIESTGTQFINLDYLVKQNTKLEIEYQTERIGGNTLFGASNNNMNYYASGLAGSTSQTGQDYPTTIKVSTNLSTEKTSLLWESAQVTYNGNVVTGKFGLDNSRLVLFKNRRWQNDSGKVKLYKFIAYDGNIIAANYIPCKNGNNDVGLYDVVSNTFYGNSGTGDLVAGPDYHPEIHVVTGNNTISVGNTDYPINLGSLELCKIGNYQDYLYKENGNWYKYGVIGKVVLNGTEDDWAVDSSGKLCSVPISDVKDYAGITSIVEGYCNYYCAGSVVSARENTNQFASFYKRLFFNNRGMTLEGYKTYIGTYNLIVYYVLDTPTITQITDETLISQLDEIYEHLKLVKGTNHITITPSDLAPYMKLNYMQDLPSKLDNLDSRLSLLE